MKIFICVTSFVTLTMPIFSHAADDKPSANADTNRAHPAGNEQREANARISLNQVVNEIVNDPQSLFERLDHDKSGQLSQEEFGRIVNAGVQGTASVQGTSGVTATGAASATDKEGATAVPSNTAAPTQPNAPAANAPTGGPQPAPGQANSNPAPIVAPTPPEAQSGQPEAKPANPQ